MSTQNAKNWKEDPRLAGMDAAKLDYLTEFANQIGSMPRSQMMTALLSMQMDAAKKKIRFTDSETGLLVSILSEGMNPAERKRIDMLRTLASKLAARKS